MLRYIYSHSNYLNHWKIGGCKHVLSYFDWTWVHLLLYVQNEDIYTHSYIMGHSWLCSTYQLLNYTITGIRKQNGFSHFHDNSFSKFEIVLDCKVIKLNRYTGGNMRSAILVCNVEEACKWLYIADYPRNYIIVDSSRLSLS